MPSNPDPPRLMFSLRAWLKWQYLCHAGPTEIGAFGLGRENDLLYVEDLIVPRQRTTAVSVAFDDAAIADLYDAMADASVPARRFARLWLHTHPGASVTPSSVDEATFGRVFGGNDWAVMPILGRTGRTLVRLRFNAGPGGSLEIPVAVLFAERLIRTHTHPQSAHESCEPMSRSSRTPALPEGCGNSWRIEIGANR